MSVYDIYGLGAALVDTEIEVTDADLTRLGIEKGLMTLVDARRQQELQTALENHLVAARRASGGSAANSIIAAQYLGARTFYSCKVADDENGHFYLNDLARAGVDYPDQCVTENAVTGRCLVMITPDAERTMNTNLGVSEYLSEKEIDIKTLQKSAWVYVEGYLVTSATGLPAAIRLLSEARASGARTALSLSDPGVVGFFYDQMQSLLACGIDILFCNEAEAMEVTRSANLEEALQALTQQVKTFAVTRGPKGAVVYDGANLVTVEAPEVHAVDTNGAGDMFAGAFLAALTRGATYENAARFANVAAATVVAQYGPRLTPEGYIPLQQQLSKTLTDQ